ncbi:MAG: cytochrome-c oxidase, cbb3-type subunit III [Gammaproteobacteria bacterium]|jgi:cytochrome c oxidase cbb3-type subunit 3
MADFTSGIWSWIIGLTTIVSIVGVLIGVRMVTSGSKDDDPEKPVETMGHVWDENLEEYNNPMPRWWLNLFYITLFWGLLYLLLYPGLGAFKGLLGWSQVGQYEEEVAAAEAQFGPLFEQYSQVPIPELAGNEDAVRIGERLFATYCTTCHGSDARGARGFPNLRDNDWLYGSKPEDLTATLTHGRNGLMPAWGAILSDQQITAVTAYVEQLSGRTADAAIAGQGKAVYDVNCIACHGPDGGGNPILGAPNLTDDIWLHGGSTTKITESIVAGRNGIMPAHGEFLGPAKIHLLATYVYKFRE